MRRALFTAFALALVACSDALPPEQRPIPAELPADARDPARKLPVEGAANLRDLGGYRTRDGRAVRWGVLYRSDALADLTDDDVSYLERLGLRRVVDFRSQGERARDPDRLPAGVAAVLQPIAGEGLDPEALQDQLLSGAADAEQAAAWLMEGNRAFVTEFDDVYARFLHDLARPDSLPTLFHCTAGKDRAGYAAALVLLALDVPREQVMRDYLLTNESTREKTESLLRLIRVVSLFRTHPDDVRPLFEARESYLGAAFDTIDAEYGSTDAYLREALGADDVLLARLRDALLE
jgi:protein-tyrosine phosphatase